MVDAKALFDTVTNETGKQTDKRVSVELSLLREEVQLDKVNIRWIPTKQNIADCLTKDFALGAEEVSYASLVVRGGYWTVGADARAPKDLRGRKLADQFIQGAKLFSSDSLQAKGQRCMIEEPDPELDPLMCMLLSTRQQRLATVLSHL